MKNTQKEEFLNIVGLIINHPKFKERSTFPHHGNISLTDHIFEVSILTYIKSILTLIIYLISKYFYLI